MTVEQRAEAAAAEAKHSADAPSAPAPNGSEEHLHKFGGLSRATLTSNEWHEAHPTAASHLFGFDTWGETKTYIWCLFLLDPPRALSSLVNTDMSAFEKCLITKMRIHRG